MPLITVKARKGRSVQSIDRLMAKLRRETSRILKVDADRVWVVYEEIGEDCSIYGDFTRVPARKRRKP